MVNCPDPSRSIIMKALLTIAMRRGVSSSLYTTCSNNHYFHLPESANKLIVADVTIAIDIIVSHQSLELDSFGEDSTQKRYRDKIKTKRRWLYLPESSKGLFEFARIQLLVPIEVHPSEDNFESAEANASLLLNGELESEVKLSDHHVLVHSVEGHCMQWKCWFS